MSVQVTNLTKIYGSQRAVHDLSFRAQPGEILGFLGPNGAGKTTTMKILTGYIAPSSGQAEVCGLDVEKAAIASRRKIGYLPEHNPLYKDMYVREYLGFVAGVYGLKKPTQRIKTLIEMTGLGPEQHKHIGALSKGYRQRVGLAQAMLHDPEVLILDEPTSGLDPNQLADIRGLIQELGKEKTVIFSTHIMQEVQAICDRVIIINRGKMVANDPIDQLKDRVKGDVLVNVEFVESVTEKQLLSIPGVKRARSLHTDRQWQLSSQKGQDIRPEVFRFAVDKKLTLIGMEQLASSVEDIFQTLTRDA